MRIGIDVGGTNTDAVLLDGRRVLGAVKSPTTEDVVSGIVAAIHRLQEQCPHEPSEVAAVMVGTTQFVNALVQGRDLAPTAAVRLALPAGGSTPPMMTWPKRMIDAISGRAYMVSGGHEYDGRPIAGLDEAELVRAAEDMGAAGIRSVAITSVFSPVNAEFEEQAAGVIASVLPDAAISLSHEIGRIGLLGRENATIVNAALRDLATRIVEGLGAEIVRTGITAPFYLTQNDGTLLDAAQVRKYPVATFASGPTNSMRGAAALSGLDSCAVADIGGTTTDIGVLTHGFPREAASDVEVAGICTNFRMPDVLSVGIGGGSMIREQGSDFAIGPDSVGYKLLQSALVFGGDTLTATDIAVAAGYCDIGERDRVAHLAPEFVKACLERIAKETADAIDRMRVSAEPLPVVAVGGGSVLLPDRLPGLGAVQRPENHAVANAIGAAIAQVGGEVDKVYATDRARSAIVDEAKQEAVDKAVAAGAEPGSVTIVDVDEIPVPYAGGATRIRVKAVGDLLIGSQGGGNA
ncbi:hydantoinase/oxoprolinase N-terminal domain-containing protein [Amycolatopsis jejuensis]|uniref:hydantoinase/oxoprolinase N-terminal domain-containing protein n=1 Tax=Amycolatopsis jejuensis TaxID=330084 RepID=UPI000525E5A0|nr:hydantoinase/oxoprolinase family protein [Amycolatopsis jejuensis]